MIQPKPKIVCQMFWESAVPHLPPQKLLFNEIYDFTSIPFHILWERARRLDLQPSIFSPIKRRKRTSYCICSRLQSNLCYVIWLNINCIDSVFLDRNKVLNSIIKTSYVISQGYKRSVKWHRQKYWTCMAVKSDILWRWKVET